MFAVSSHFATRAYMEYKTKNNLQEGAHGERRGSNVFYAALVGTVLTLFNFLRPAHLPYFTLFAISLSVVNADTFASEIGVIDRNVYMITNFKRTVPGVNGGVSLTGEMAALGGSLIVGIAYLILVPGRPNPAYFAAVVLMGFLGCQIDSVLGATLENREKLTKGEVNLISSLLPVIISALIFY
ncbi:hypothetical protein GCM10007108_09610 [Thermogymnomonas acidicola]|uniref:DUF92 domain-containing protein n=1 Tax=Thermogymnomonas acidicola TaxID=399579 RepID=A0AA37BR87_9ARCH|nr:hypothetical protein GCM10007108_09610 [Thermogymnomonas acidicola]